MLWTSLAAAFLAGVSAHGDDTSKNAPAPPPPGFKDVKVGDTFVRVTDQHDPLKNVSEGNGPEKIFSHTSAFADKSFAVSADPFLRSAQTKDSDAFASRSYATGAASAVPNVNTKAAFNATPFQGRGNPDFDKAFPTATADTGAHAAALGAGASPDQDRTAMGYGQVINGYAAPFAQKEFHGSEEDAVHRHLSKLPNGQILISDIPDRPLTIDEVRDLINHGVKPDTDAKPPDASKPLNDPNYQPQPLRGDPTPTPARRVGDDDKDDAVPPPGTMGAPPAPENAEPLPQQP